MHSGLEYVEDRYIVYLANKKDNFHRAFGPLTKKQAISLRASFRRGVMPGFLNEHEIKVIQCWEVLYDDHDDALDQAES